MFTVSHVLSVAQYVHGKPQCTCCVHGQYVHGKLCVHLVGHVLCARQTVSVCAPLFHGQWPRPSMFTVSLTVWLCVCVFCVHGQWPSMFTVSHVLCSRSVAQYVHGKP